MEARSYTLGDLEAHLKQSYDETSPLIPVSPGRLASYLHNPRADPSDHVLFEMREGDSLIAYRTLLPDLFFDVGGTPRRFAWLSGNYVLPPFRRKGLSTRLLQLAEARWEGRLMYTNYAPDSKAVYDRSGQFRVLALREGQRFYLRAGSSELLKGRTVLHSLLPVADRLINLKVEKKLKKYTPDLPDDCHIRRVTEMDDAMEELAASSGAGTLFRRNREVFRWILQYPWVSTEANPSLHYHFSHHSGQFENLLYRFESKGTGGIGWLWLLVHGSRLGAPYVYTSDQGIISWMAATMIDTMIRHRCGYTTVRHDGLRNALAARRKWFLSARRMPQLVFCHKQLKDHIPGEFTLQDGDGDVVFTG